MLIFQGVITWMSNCFKINVYSILYVQFKRFITYSSRASYTCFTRFLTKQIILEHHRSKSWWSFHFVFRLITRGIPKGEGGCETVLNTTKSIGIYVEFESFPKLVKAADATHTEKLPKTNESWGYLAIYFDFEGRGAVELTSLRPKKSQSLDSQNVLGKSWNDVFVI